MTLFDTIKAAVKDAVKKHGGISGASGEAMILVMSGTDSQGNMLAPFSLVDGGNATLLSLLEDIGEQTLPIEEKIRQNVEEHRKPKPKPAPQPVANAPEPFTGITKEQMAHIWNNC